MITIVSERLSASLCHTEVQKIIAKYGLAAHLAILAVAPLFLLPFTSEDRLVAVLLWLSLAAVGWMMLEPSVLAGERLSEARQRVRTAVRQDPLFWVSVIVVLISGVRALNTGIALAYDAERSIWHISKAAVPLIPGSVGNAGRLPFAALLAASVLIQACRHSLGRSARMVFVLLSSSLAGIAAVLTHVSVQLGYSEAAVLVDSTGTSFSSVGLAYGIYMLTGTVALVGVLKEEWNSALILPVLAIGGAASGLFSFAPAYISFGFAVSEVVLILYAVVFSRRFLNAAGEVKQAAIILISVALAGLLSAAFLPESLLEARLAVFSDWVFFTERFWDVRSALSQMAFKAWASHLWIGTGVGSFPLDFRFGAAPADWTLLPTGAVAVANCWWQLLSERGLVGLVAFVLPIGFLLFTYLRRMIGSFAHWSMPHPICLLTAMLVMLLGLASFVDCSPMRTEVLMVSGAVMAVSAASFSKGK